MLKDFPEWSVDKVTAKVGVTSRHLAADNETAGDLAEKAARRLFEEYGNSPSEIDFFIASAHKVRIIFAFHGLLAANIG